MSDSLVLFPYDASDSMSEWLESMELDPPQVVGRVPDQPLLESILTWADWPYRTNEREGVWEARFESREERWPPIQELTLRERSVGFRLGPLYGPFLVAREVARECGPQIAVAGSAGNPCVVGPETTYEQFHAAVVGIPAPEDRSDRQWSQPPTVEWKYAHSAPEEWPRSPEGWLDYALSRRRGHARAAGQVGAAIRGFLMRDQAGTRPHDTLDEARYSALVTRLVGHIRSSPSPDATLVLAVGPAPQARAELEAMVKRLEGVPGAEEARRMAMICLANS